MVTVSIVIMSVILISISIILDQVTKGIAQKKLTTITRQRAFFSFALVKNKGAFRGLFKGNKKLLIGIQLFSMIVIALMLGFFINKKDKTTSVGLSLILGGAIGNLIDRLKNGYVTDFFAIKWTKNLYYNLADMCIFLGAFITLIKEILKH